MLFWTRCHEIYFVLLFCCTSYLVHYIRVRISSYRVRIRNNIILYHCHVLFTFYAVSVTVFSLCIEKYAIDGERYTIGKILQDVHRTRGQVHALISYNIYDNMMCAVMHPKLDWFVWQSYVYTYIIYLCYIMYTHLTHICIIRTQIK